MQNIYDSSEIIMQSVSEHYQSEFLRTIINIVGSIEIIGNPVGLI